MSYWAELDENNIVLRVTVGDDNDPNGDEGHQWLVDNIGGTWVQTYSDGSIRKRYAGVGMYYDKIRDAFLYPQPFPSWILDEETCLWEAPLLMPTDDKMYNWDEATLSWKEVN